MGKPYSREVGGKLTARQARFVDEYLIDLNGAQAAIRAGYSTRNVSVQASALMGIPKVCARIDQAMAARSRKIGIDAEWVLRRLVEEANADIADLYDEDGRLRPVRDWPKIWRQGLVQAVETAEEDGGVTVRRVRLPDRIRRLELIGKHVGVKAFEERLAVSGMDGLAERLKRAIARAEQSRR